MALAFLVPLLLAPVPDVPPVVAAGGTTYAVEAGHLVRRGRARDERLGCTLAGGPGAIRGLAAHPGGTVLVAAQRGLFTIADGFERLDALDLGDGAPRGDPVGVGVADEDRLWLLTGDAFGAVDARQGFGRVIGPQDGVPAGPYLGLRVGAEGEVWIQTAATVFRYTPDQGPGPSLGLRSVDGRPFVPGACVEVGAHGGLRLELAGAGNGGATFRYRARRHHLWRALDPADARIEGLEPGEHELLLAAFDRDLRRSPPVALLVSVPYPRALSRAVLLPVVGGGCLAVLALFLLAARRRRSGGLRAVASAFVLCAVVLQLVAAALPHARGWPFVGFTMYTERYGKDALTWKMALELIRPDGSRARVEPYDAGYGLFEFRQTLSEQIHGDGAARGAFLASCAGGTAASPAFASSTSAGA